MEATTPTRVTPTAAAAAAVGVSLPPPSPGVGGGSGRVAVWLDCDPGVDDAFAIMLAGYSPRLRLIGISTVAGNVSVERCTTNALTVAHAAGLGYLPVVAGAAKPLTAPPGRAATVGSDVHGVSGLATAGGVPLPPLPPERKAVASKAVNYVYHCIHNHAAAHPTERVTLLATGALTNVALLLAVYPEIKDDLREIVVMGGSTARGNVTPAAEFNIFSDPEAAYVVFHNGAVPVTMVPLDVTLTSSVSPAALACLTQGGSDVTKPPPLVPGDSDAGVAAVDAVLAAAVSPFRRLAAALLLSYGGAYAEHFATPRPPLHDPCAVFYVIDPAAFKAVRARVEVETASTISRGQTVVDVTNVGGWRDDQKNVNVALAMDVPAFWRAMLDAVAAADARSCLNPTPSYLLPRPGSAAALPRSPTTATTAAAAAADAAATAAMAVAAATPAKAAPAPAPAVAGSGAAAAADAPQ